MRRLPKHYAPFIYGVIQAAITSAVATVVATYGIASLELQFVVYWLECWGISVLTMLPVVILVSPLIQRAVFSLTEAKTPSESV